MEDEGHKGLDKMGGAGLASVGKEKISHGRKPSFLLFKKPSFYE